MKIRLFSIPNIVTLCNLLCGIGSIISSVVYGNLMLAGALIVLAAVFDFFDGFTARLLKQYSEIGVQLDSLADMVSFGTAPAFAMYAFIGGCDFIFPAIKEYAVFIPFLMTAFSALRLAKFNIDDTQHEEFEGLTTTANGIFCTSFIASLIYSETAVAGEWMILICVICACLLISPIRMFSFKFASFKWADNKLRYIFVILCVAIIAALKLYAVPAIIVLYTVVSTIRWVAKR